MEVRRSEPLTSHSHIRLDHQIPARYGSRQVVGGTLGIDSISRAVCTIPVVLDIAHDKELRA